MGTGQRKRPHDPTTPLIWMSSSSSPIPPIKHHLEGTTEETAGHEGDRVASVKALGNNNNSNFCFESHNETSVSLWNSKQKLLWLSRHSPGKGPPSPPGQYRGGP
jgi:hypothetical protein